MSIDFEADAKQAEQMDSKLLSAVSALAAQANCLESEVEALERQRKEKAEQLRKIVEEELPEAMQELGLTKLELEDGSSISVTTQYFASIPEEKKPDAFIWLRQRGHDSLIKHEFTVTFGKGEDEAAVAFDTLTREQGYEPKEKVTVHPQTLRAFVREQVEQGTPVPDELFGVHIINKAQIRR